jgi:hypothetical protein
MARTGTSIVVWREARRRQEGISFHKLVAMAKGKMRIIDLKFRCTRCRSRLSDFVVSGWHVGPVAYPTFQRGDVGAIVKVPIRKPECPQREHR